MVLLLCLIFLTALTLLGLSVSADTLLQTRLSANLQETERTRQAAMTTLTWAEDWLLGLEGSAPAHCTSTCDGLYLHPEGNLPPHPEQKSSSWWADNGHEAGINPLNGERMQEISGDGPHPPAWIIEAVHSVPVEKNGSGYAKQWYRILARASGGTTSVVSVVESTVVRSWLAGSTPGNGENEVSKTCPGQGSANECRRVSWRKLR